MPLQPELSVVVPSYGRSARLALLLQRLAVQTLAADRFEVVAVDDGSPEPIEVDARELPYAFTLLRQDNAGPAAARNLAFEHCRAALVLILNDDAVPAPDLLERHLAIHADAAPRTAVLGSFPFTERALARPFVQLLAESDLLFDFSTIRNGEVHGWRYFWTCNLSLPLEPILSVGGFDAETFDQPVMEDVELGYRLEQQGWRVLYREDARCEHDHALTADAYLERMRLYGLYLVRMWQKHGDPSILGVASAEQIEPALQRLQLQYEALRPRLTGALESFATLDRAATPAKSTLASAQQVLRAMRIVPMVRGVALGLHGRDPEKVAVEGPRGGCLTSVIVVSRDGHEDTRRCLEALRATRVPDFPLEVIFVDNGSKDGSVEYLRAQPDVTLIENDENRGAPQARNQALRVAAGEWIVVLDNDVTVYDGWLARLRYHAEIDPAVGCVVPLADRAAHGQQIAAPDGTVPRAPDAFAARLAAESDRRASYKKVFSSLLVLMRREVIERIGGFDERFSPWGFEDDDFSLRVHLAGYRARLAHDVFVHHAAYTGPKTTRHQALLERNWRRFVGKWGGSTDQHYGDQYGDYGFLEGVIAREWPEASLRVPIEGGAFA